MNKISIFLLFSISLLFSFSSCKKDDEKKVAGEIQLKFTQTVADLDAHLHDKIYEHPSGYLFNITKLEYYITDITLHGSDGKDFIIDKVLYQNINKGETKSLIVSNVAGNDYTSVSVTFGIPESKNTVDILENNTSNQSMLWPEGLQDPTGQNNAAYHYMKFEGSYTNTKGIETTFRVHLGPTNGNDNSFISELACDNFTVDNNTTEITINVDILEWLQNPNLYDFNVEPAGIMPIQEKQEMVKANGHNVFSVTEVKKK